VTDFWSEQGQRQQREASLRRAWPVVVLALTWMAGIVLGRWLPTVWVWAPLAAVTFLGMSYWLWRRRDWPARCWGLLAVLALAAGWFVVSTEHVPADHITHFLPKARSTIAAVHGRVTSEPHLASSKRGPFGQFSYKPPTTMARLELTHLRISGEKRPVSGAILLKISGADTRLKQGQRVRATGWLSRVDAARNPGGAGYRNWLERRGMSGRISLPSPSNYTVLRDSSGGWLAAFQRWRQALREQARSTLALGIDDRSRAHDLLATVLLGVRSSDSAPLRQDFREVGLAHLLAISGAHLGILLGLLWFVVRFVGLGPRAATLVLIVATLLYLLMVPARVPIVRASIMAGLLLGGRWFGREGNGLTMLALAALVVLIWRPGDLFSPGFQLSFTAVTALILFARPVSQWLWRPHFIEPEHIPLGQKLMRRAVDYLAVCVIALLVVTPLVAYHFHVMHPLSAVMSILALPAFAAVLGIGYLKMVLGLIWPSASLLLSGPAAWAGTSLATLVQQASHWPGVHVTLLQQPSLLWVLGMMSGVAGVLTGWFARRRLALVAVIGLLAGWTVAEQKPWGLALFPNKTDEPAVTLRMLAVGDGSCYLVESGGRAVMFDCGSRTYLDVAKKTVLPTLRQLETGRIDALMLSHPDLDHFSGAVTLMRRWPVGQVMAPPQLLRDASRSPHGPTGHLVDQLRKEGTSIEPIQRGFSRSLGQAQLEVLWPPEGYSPNASNNGSLVLAIEVAGRRLLLNGDIQKNAMRRLMKSDASLTAAVTDLPHHGSFTENAPRWLDAVGPRRVLQSSGPVLPTGDEWAPVLQKRDIDRLISDEVGMVTVEVMPNGTIETRTYRGER
jgi:competence protein ComEC